jgi:mono/diheme cytochrome c family protein
MKKLIVMLIGFAVFASCGKSKSEGNETAAPAAEAETSEMFDKEAYDPNRGEGKFTTVELGEKLDPALATAGESVAGVKCTSCHKLTDEKLVGPGWKGVTERRKPEWIMNFITNPDPMIDKDPELQSQLELCLVRMPNQGLNDEEAHQILEYMRKNDGVQ